MAQIRGTEIGDNGTLPVSQGNVAPLGGMPTESTLATPTLNIPTPIPTPEQEAARRGVTPPIAEPTYQETTMAPNPQIQALEQQNIDRSNLLLDRERTILDNAAEVKRLQGQQLSPSPNDTTYTGGVGTGSTTTTGGGGGTQAPKQKMPTTGGTGSSGDELVKQALETKFTWSAETDPDYKIAATDLENDIAQKMIGRGGLWSSVTQSALQSGMVKLQATYRQQAYENYKENRNFLMQVAQMQYGREDEAWNRNMEVLKYNADREDAAFAKNMQLQNQADARATAQFNREMAAAQQIQQQAGAKLNMEANQLAANYSSYQTMLDKWKSNGRATSEIASYFGVAEGTSVTNAYALSAIARKEQIFTAKQKEIQDLAYNYNQDEIYIEGLQEDYYMANPPSIDPIASKDITQVTSVSGALEYRKIMNPLMTSTAEKIGAKLEELTANASTYIKLLGENGYIKTLYDLDQLQREVAKTER